MGRKYRRATTNLEKDYVKGLHKSRWFITLCRSLFVAVTTVWCIAFYSDWGYHCLLMWAILHGSYGMAQVLSSCPLFHTSARSPPWVSRHDVSVLDGWCIIILIDKGLVHNWLHMKYDLPIMIWRPENSMSFQVLHPIYMPEKNASLSPFIGNVH